MLSFLKQFRSLIIPTILAIALTLLFININVNSTIYRFLIAQHYYISALFFFTCKTIFMTFTLMYFIKLLYSKVLLKKR
jgi:hypothetical protein